MTGQPVPWGPLFRRADDSTEIHIGVHGATSTICGLYPRRGWQWWGPVLTILWRGKNPEDTLCPDCEAIAANESNRLVAALDEFGP
jgi:hypothetical protein